MKRYIILSAMLALTLGLSAQPNRTDRKKDDNSTTVRENKTRESSETTENKNVSTPVRTRESSGNSGTPERTRTVTREPQSNPGYNRSSNEGNRSSGNSNPVYRRESTPSNDGPRTRGTYNGNRENRSSTVVRDGGNPGSNNGVRNRGESRSNGTRDRGASGNSGSVRNGEGNRSYGTRGRVENGNSGVRDGGESRNYGVRDRGQSSNRQVNRNPNTYTERRVYVPKNEQQYARERRVYVTPERHVTVVRQATRHDYEHRPLEYRRSYYPYRAPGRPDIIWSIHLYNEYRGLYPDYDYWYYPEGYRIHTVSSYDADRYIGEFARIYGQVFDVWYSFDSDEYYLYFGESYPYQDFTVILDGRDARRFSRRPEGYFEGRYMAVTGVVSMFEGKPEMLIKRRSQIDLYH